MKISATIITLNEEKNIGECLDSLDFVDEIVVVDSGSSDRTEEICRSNPKVRFFSRPWDGFGRQKNLAAELVNHDWIFNIDADERVTEQLACSIGKADFSRFDAFRVARKNHFGGRWIRYCGWYPDYNIRLYNRRSCSFSVRQVHEAVACRTTAPVLHGDLLHFTYDDISDYLKRMERYSSLAAEELIAAGKRPTHIAVLLRPCFTFFKMFLIKRGFLEGYTGFVISALYSFYTFSKYAKALELKKDIFQTD